MSLLHKIVLQLPAKELCNINTHYKTHDLSLVLYYARKRLLRLPTSCQRALQFTAKEPCNFSQKSPAISCKRAPQYQLTLQLTHNPAISTHSATHTQSLIGLVRRSQAPAKSHKFPPKSPAISRKRALQFLAEELCNINTHYNTHTITR